MGSGYPKTLKNAKFIYYKRFRALMKRVKITVFGQVQGVFFRANTAKLAIELGIVGFVRNQDENSVLVVAQGEDDSIKELIAFCRRGPLSSKIDSIEIIDEKIDNEFREFNIL